MTYKTMGIWPLVHTVNTLRTATIKSADGWCLVVWNRSPIILNLLKSSSSIRTLVGKSIFSSTFVWDRPLLVTGHYLLTHFSGLYAYGAHFSLYISDRHRTSHAWNNIEIWVITNIWKKFMDVDTFWIFFGKCLDSFELQIGQNLRNVRILY